MATTLGATALATHHNRLEQVRPTLQVRTKPRFKWRQSDIDARLRRLSLVDELTKGERDARA